MRLWFFDVEHGSCACLITDAGEVVLFDAGTNSTTGFTPSRWLKGNGYDTVDQLVISHFDADHVADVHNLKSDLRVKTVRRNPSVSAAQIRAEKVAGGGLTKGLSAALDIHESYGGPITQPLSVDIRTWYNTPTDFSDQNNLSLVAILSIPGMRTVFPGDVEAAGWKNLFKDTEFCRALNAVDFFVASHHGRHSGFTSDLFTGGAPRPSLFLISDKPVYETNPPDYGPYAKGVWFGEVGTRHVLTTRRDGNIYIESRNGGAYVRYGFSF